MRYSDDSKNRISGRWELSKFLVHNVKNKKVLDIGCYNGWFSNWASFKGANVFSIEVNNKFKKHYDSNVNFLVGNTNFLSFNKNSFDVVVLFDVLEHIPEENETAVLKEIYRVLKKGGKFFISVPNNKLISNLLDPAYWLISHRHYKKKDLRLKLCKTGFKIKRFYCRGGIFSAIYVPLHYFFKKIHLEVPLKNWFDKKRLNDYKKKGFLTLFFEVVK